MAAMMSFIHDEPMRHSLRGNELARNFRHILELLTFSGEGGFEEFLSSSKHAS
jgi:hypothetical protein